MQIKLIDGKTIEVAHIEERFNREGYRVSDGRYTQLYSSSAYDVNGKRVAYSDMYPDNERPTLWRAAPPSYHWEGSSLVKDE